MDHRFITSDTLFPLLHAADAPAILDMRMADDAATDPRRIPGARAVELAEIETGGPSQPTVCFCETGGKLSQLGAAILRDRGVDAVALRGGHLAWIAVRLPTTASDRLADRWVMPMDPSWAELGALWTLRRLIDREARVTAVERDWQGPAAQAWSARALPADAAALATLAGLTHPILDRLDGGPEAVLAGRLTRVASPDGALDLVDDWLAAPRDLTAGAAA